MDVTQKPLRAMALVPGVVNSIEGLFGRHSGREKKASAMAFVLAALHLRESVESGEVVDEDRFKEGLSKMIDGAAECLKASVWTRRERATAGVGRQQTLEPQGTQRCTEEIKNGVGHHGERT